MNSPSVPDASSERLFESMACSEAALRSNPAAWAEFVIEVEMWAGDLDSTGACDSG